MESVILLVVLRRINNVTGITQSVLLPDTSIQRSSQPTSSLHVSSTLLEVPHRLPHNIWHGWATPLITNWF
ncbi:hypothetical protein RIF29_22113 [Crotalaria pallida]|uniref:Uncharacterized protein n=1 Tax=Crotalaria pallida TaxID=3830 RepID=A0AAN9F3S7_CROPI